MLNFDFSSLTPSAIATLASGMMISLQVAGTALAVGLVWRHRGDRRAGKSYGNSHT